MQVLSQLEGTQRTYDTAFPLCGCSPPQVLHAWEGQICSFKVVQNSWPWKFAATVCEVSLHQAEVEVCCIASVEVTSSHVWQRATPTVGAAWKYQLWQPQLGDVWRHPFNIALGATTCSMKRTDRTLQA